MDPATIIGTTAAVLDLVHYGVKFVSIVKTIYKSASGKSVDGEEVEKLCLQVKKLSLGLKSSSSKSPGTEAQKSLSTLAEQCLRTSDEITAILDECTAKNPHSLRATLVPAIKSVLKKVDIEHLQHRLDSYQHSLSLALLAVMKEETRQSLELLKDTGFKQLTELKAIEGWISRLEKTRSNVGVAEGEALPQLREVLSLCEGANLTIQRLRSYLEELKFREIDARISDIDPAYPTTFEYMFETEASPTNAYPILGKMPFKTWMLNGQGIFHIAGKPGSGKSTLMKYLFEHHETKSSLKKWAGDPKNLVLAKFFFWKYGSPLQKNLKGLLRSLLYTVLSKSPDFIEYLFDSQSRKEKETIFQYTGRMSLTNQEISSAFDRLVQGGQDHGELAHRFCFFIDGLDEFGESEENYWDLVVRLQKWTQVSKGRVKLCVSSRELPVFGHISPDQKVHLHLLTESDIQKVVDSQITVEANFQAIRRKSPKAAKDCDALVEEIVVRAEGVFLWVHLVLRTLRKGLLENRDSIIKLRQKLEVLPSELNEYFQYMLDSVEPVYRMEAYRTFAVAMKAATSTVGNALSLFRYYILFEMLEDEQYALELPFSSLDADEIESRLGEARERLSARCDSLLEVRQSRYGSSGGKEDHVLYRDHVAFLHRSVPDWLSETLADRVKGFDVEEAICHSLLGQIKCVALNQTLIQHVTNDLVDVLRQISLRDNSTKPLLPLLNVLDEGILVRQGMKTASESRGVLQRTPSLPYRKEFLSSKWSPSIVSLSHISAYLGLANCLSHLLHDEANLAKGNNGVSLLECVIHAFLSKSGIWSEDYSGHLHTLSVLFKYGVSVHAQPSNLFHSEFSKVSIWHGFISCAFSPDPEISNNLIKRQDFWAAVELFLDHKAVPSFSLTSNFRSHYEDFDFVIFAQCDDVSYNGTRITWQWEVPDGHQIVSLLKSKGGHASLKDLTEFHSPYNCQKIVELINKAASERAMGKRTVVGVRTGSEKAMGDKAVVGEKAMGEKADERSQTGAQVQRGVPKPRSVVGLWAARLFQSAKASASSKRGSSL